MSKPIEKIIKINGINLWTSLQGRGNPIVLCHGGPGAYDYLEPVAELLEDRFTVLRYDQRGSGRSGRGGDLTVDSFVEDLEQLRVHFGWDSWIVAGHSWGASLSLTYAVKYPERTEKAIYISGVGVNPEWRAVYHQNRAKMLGAEDRMQLEEWKQRILGETGDDHDMLFKKLMYLIGKIDVFDQKFRSSLPSFSEYPINSELNVAVSEDMERLNVDPNFRTKIEALTTPVKIIHGLHDPRSVAFPEELNNLLLDSQISIMEKSGHWPWIEQPEQFTIELKRFLEE
ncbi:alpha/beta fold hydrolase [Calditrichota bacterium]